MRIQFIDWACVLLACKIIVGCVCAVVAFASAEDACPANVFCLDLGHRPSLGVWPVSNMLLAIALLVSAFRDLLRASRWTELLPRDIEAVASLDREDLDFGLPNQAL